MSTYDPAILQEIKEYTPHRLANLADSYSENDEAGDFLSGIRDAVLEKIDHITDPDDWDRLMVDDYSGDAHEVADGAPSAHHTWTLWQEFLGTQAWQEDPSELGASGDDMTQAAATCLFIIAGRLVYALAQEIQDSITDDDEEGTA